MSGVLWGFATKADRRSGDRRLCPVGDPRALGVFHDGRRAGIGGDEPDRRFPGACFCWTGISGALALRPHGGCTCADAADHNRRLSFLPIGFLMAGRRAPSRPMMPKPQIMPTDGQPATHPTHPARLHRADPARGPCAGSWLRPCTASAHMRDAGLVPIRSMHRKDDHDCQRKFGLPARLGEFDDIDGDEIYDGVWANFSLLHAARDDLPRHFDCALRGNQTPAALFMWV